MDASLPEPNLETIPKADQPQVCCKPSRCFGPAIICAALLVGILQAVFIPKFGHNWMIGPPLLKADAKNLKHTLVSSHLDAAIAPGKNVLWCSTFQLVWNEGCRFAGGDIHLENEPPMVAALNKKAADENDLDADSCLVMSGLMKDDILGKIRRELEKKFRGQANPDLLDRIAPSIPPDGWLAYAYLFRELPFEYPFKRLDEPLVFGSRRVASFGLRKLTNRMGDIHKAEQVVVLDYQNDDDFVLELKPKEKSEWIVLAKIAPAATLQETIEKLRSRIAASKLSEHKRRLSSGESLAVPILDFDLWQSYDELCDKKITTPGPLHDMPIILAIQNIRFRFDERGAILKSEAAMAACEGELKKPRQFIFDKPFLILLERRGALRPYFTLWVDNPELLMPL